MVKNLPTVERSKKIRFGKHATDDQAENTIVFNATEAPFDTTTPNATYMAPLRIIEDRDNPNVVIMTYNRLTKELADSGKIIGESLFTDLQKVSDNGNITTTTLEFTNPQVGFITTANVGIANTLASHTLDVGSNLYIDDTGSNILVVNGNVEIQNDLFVQRNVEIQKDLFVQGNAHFRGTVTVIDTENLSIKDPIVELGSNNTTGTNSDLGLLLKRPTSNVIVGFKESSDEIIFAYTQDGAENFEITPLTSQDVNVHVYGRLYTESNVGVMNTNPVHTLDVGSKLYVDDSGSNVLVVTGNTAVSGSLHVNASTLVVDSENGLVGIGTNQPAYTLDVHGTSNVGVLTSNNISVVGNAHISSNLTVDTDTFHVDADNGLVGVGTLQPGYKLDVHGTSNVGPLTATQLAVDTDTLYISQGVNRVGINTDTPGANLHVEGNTHISSILTVGDNIGIHTNQPEANLHVEGNVYVSSNLTVNTDTLHVDAGNNMIGVGTIQPQYKLDVHGTSNVGTLTATSLIVDSDTLFVNATNDSVGINTDEPSANLHVVGNAYVSSDLGVGSNLQVDGDAYILSNLTVNNDTLVVKTNIDSVGINTSTPNANLHVEGNVYISSNLTVDTDTFHVDTENSLVGVGTKNPEANLHVVGNVYVSSNLTVDTDTLHVDAASSQVGVGTTEPGYTLDVHGTSNVGALTATTLNVDSDTLFVNDKVGINTGTPGANLEVVGNVYVSSNLTVYIDTFHVDAESGQVGVGTTEPQYTLDVHGTSNVGALTATTLYVNDKVGINTDEPSANLHVVGNAYVSSDLGVGSNLQVDGDAYILSNLTVNNDTLVVKTDIDSVGINTSTPNANLHVVGNVYISSNLTVDTDTFHVDTENSLVGVGTKNPEANLHVEGNVYVSSNLTVDIDTLHVDAENDRVGINTSTPGANLHVEGNVYVSSNLTVDTDTLHVDAGTNMVGIGTILPRANLEVSGNVYVSSNVEADMYFGDGGNLSNVSLQVVSDHGNTTSNIIQFTNPTTAFMTDLTSNVGVNLNQLKNISINTPLNEQILIYDEDVGVWVNEYPIHNYIKVYNGTGVELQKGSVVYVVDSHNGNIVNVALADASEPSKMPAVGIVYENIGVELEGIVVAYGKAQKLNTLNFQEGETIYVSNTTPGGVSNVKPLNSTDGIQNIGICVKAHQFNGIIFVTGVGRTNDIPNAPIITSNPNFVYGNDSGNDFKKIVPSDLLTKLQTLEQVVNTGNTVSNTIQITGGLTTTQNVVVGSNIFVTGIADPTNKYLPMVDTNGKFIQSPVYISDDGKYVISASQAEFSGDANFEDIEANTINITDTTSTTSKTSGALIVAGGVGISGNVHATHANFEDVEANTINITGTTVSTSKTSGALIVTGGVGISGNVHATQANFENVEADSVNITDDTSTTSKTSGALIVTGGVGISGNVHATHANFENVEADSVNITDDTSTTSKTSGALIVTGGVGISGNVHATHANFENVEADSVNITDTTSTTSKTSGALIVAGGVGISGNVHATHANFENVEADSVNITDDTSTTSKTSGALIVTGGVGISGNVHATHANFENIRLTNGITNTSAPTNQIVFATTDELSRFHAIKSQHTTQPFGLGNTIEFFVGNPSIDLSGTVATTQVMTLEGTSNVGIGTTQPQFKLDVNGDLRCGNVHAIQTDFDIVADRVNISGNIHATHANFEDVEADSVNITDTTSSALQVAGGVSIASNISVGGTYSGELNDRVKTTELLVDDTIIAFHHGDYTSFYTGDTDVYQSTADGRVWANSPPGRYSWGQLIGVASNQTNTTYAYDPIEEYINTDILLIAAGGGGGSGHGGTGGGGAGGKVFSPNILLSSGSKTIVVGAGGAGGISGNDNDPSDRGTNGANTEFTGLTTALGGGGGGSSHLGSLLSPDFNLLTQGIHDGRDGGCGGGGSSQGFAPAGIPPDGDGGEGSQGGNGGNAFLDNNRNYGGGGGGGLDGAGYDEKPTLLTGGNGGAGKDFSLYFTKRFGVSGYFGGGGGGGGLTSDVSKATIIPGNGGLGGGGDGSQGGDGNDGTSHTGGGGGGGGSTLLVENEFSEETGGSGGSGIVLIRRRVNDTRMIQRVIRGNHAQYVINGGGVVTFNAGGYLKWTQRIIIQMEVLQVTGDGFINIFTPDAGIQIDHYNGSNELVKRTVTGDGILLESSETLWYRVKPGSGPTSNPENFVITHYLNERYSTDENWILIATRNNDNNSIKFVPGQVNIPKGTLYNTAVGSIPGGFEAKLTTTFNVQNVGITTLTFDSTSVWGGVFQVEPYDSFDPNRLGYWLCSWSVVFQITATNTVNSCFAVLYVDTDPHTDGSSYGYAESKHQQTSSGSAVVNVTSLDTVLSIRLHHNVGTVVVNPNGRSRFSATYLGPG